MGWSNLTMYQRRILHAFAKSYGCEELHTIKVKSHYKERVLGKLIRKQPANVYEGLKEACRDLERMEFIRITKTPYWPEDITFQLTNKGAKFLKSVTEEEEKETLKEDIRKGQEKQRKTRKRKSVDEREADFNDIEREREKPDEIGEEDDPTLGTSDEWDWDDYDPEGLEEWDD